MTLLLLLDDGDAGMSEPIVFYLTAPQVFLPGVQVGTGQVVS